ncbi:MAG: hypothetical protein L0177_11525 [Chloroflexi bacterium]|nr:hypothetical protein [Chloroflexota bacterium]
MNQFTKFAVGDLVYKHPSTRQREGDAGIVVRLMIGQEGDEPHVVFRCPDGSNSPIMDCSKVGYGGGPPRKVNQASAIVKWLVSGDTMESVPVEDSHQEWPVEQVTNDWALARDPWDKRLHWLTRGGEYRLWVGGNDRCHIVTVQTLLIE